MAIIAKFILFKKCRLQNSTNNDNYGKQIKTTIIERLKKNDIKIKP